MCVYLILFFKTNAETLFYFINKKRYKYIDPRKRFTLKTPSYNFGMFEIIWWTLVVLARYLQIWSCTHNILCLYLICTHVSSGHYRKKNALSVLPCIEIGGSSENTVAISLWHVLQI